jgi:hypothetical protein
MTQLTVYNYGGLFEAAGAEVPSGYIDELVEFDDGPGYVGRVWGYCGTLYWSVNGATKELV